MQTNFSARLFSAEDWQIFKAIRLEALTIEPTKYGSSLAIEGAHTEEFWRKFLTDDSQAMFGLFDGNQVIGMRGVRTWTNEILPIAASREWEQHPTTRTALIVSGYIRAEYRGKRLSRLLFAACTNWVAARPEFCRLLMAYRKSNFIMQNFCKRINCRPVEAHPFDWFDGVREDVVIEEFDLEDWRNKSNGFNSVQ